MSLAFSQFGQPEMKIVELVADARNLQVLISARKDGIMAAILNMMGIAGTASIQGDVEGCTVERSSFSGQSRTYVAWSQVSATTHSVTKGVGFLGAAFGLAVAGASSLAGGRNAPPTMLALIFFALAAVMVVLFFLKRSVSVGLVTTGGMFEMLKLKGSAAQMAELKDVMKVMELLNRAASEGEGGHRHEHHAPAAPRTTATEPAAETTVATCPSCNARMKVPAGRAGQAMRCPKCSETFTL